MFLANIAKSIFVSGVVNTGLGLIGINLKTPVEKRAEIQKEKIIKVIREGNNSVVNNYNYNVDLSEVIELLNEENKLIQTRLRKIRTQVVIAFIFWLAVAQIGQAFVIRDYIDNAVRYIVYR